MQFKDYLSEEKENRYVVTISMYMFDKDDKSVVKQANKFVRDLQKKYDNDAQILEIVEQEFGSSGNRKVKI